MELETLLGSGSCLNKKMMRLFSRKMKNICRKWRKLLNNIMILGLFGAVWLWFPTFRQRKNCVMSFKLGKLYVISALILGMLVRRRPGRLLTIKWLFVGHNSPKISFGWTWGSIRQKSSISSYSTFSVFFSWL